MTTHPGPPQPSTESGPRSVTLWTADNVPIQVSLTSGDENILVSGPQDSVLVPVQGLNTRPDETGYVGEQVASTYRAKVAANDAGDQQAQG